MTARRFELHRDIDETGVSGIGVIAEGVEFSDGTVAMRWLTDWNSTAVYEQGMRAIDVIHGHGGKTRIVRVDGAD